ncbi:MAG: protein kinase [Opitutaceae bacterium]|nr:protein kinase [Opitutaceae bacterium]
MNETIPPEQPLFEHALALGGEERRAYLERACGGDAALLARVNALLDAHERAGGFMDTPAPHRMGTPARAAEVMAGEKIGRYKLLEKIGEGGWGEVYLAEQEEPVRRRVALKVIKLGMDTAAVVARFEAERQALALMEHPNIARVFDGGATAAGRPYFVMELVRGVPITDFCDQERLSTRERLELFTQVCHAVQHAHQKGVIHRDLKPSNILVTLHDDKAVPKVIDFGIAKATEQRLTEKTLFTRFHQFVGTPAYMSPEQTGLSGIDVDTRSDIYSLGVLLYELLTGRTPFDPQALLAAGYEEIQRVICETEPPRPSHRLTSLSAADLTTTAQRRRLESRKLVSELRGDLDWIVLRCLQKDRKRRYETAQELALDLTRHLAHERVLARPDRWSYRAAKFVRRHRGPVAFVVVVFVLLLAGLAGTVTQARRAQRHAAMADAQRERANEARQRADAQRQRADEARDKALVELSRAEAINDLNAFLLKEAAPGGQPITLGELLARAEAVVDHELADTEENRVEMLVTIGSYYSNLEMQGKAIEVLERAYARALALPDGSLRPYAGATLAKALAGGGEFDRAEQIIASALAEVIASPGNETTHVYCLKSGSQIARQAGKLALAVERAEAAHRIVEGYAAGSGLFKVSSAMELAETYRMAGRWAESAALFATTRTQLNALGRQETEKAGTLLNNWALALVALGRPREAESMYRRAIGINGGAVSDEGMSPLLLNNLARALIDLGRYDEASRLADRSLSQARKFDDGMVANQALLSLARIRTSQGDLDRAAAALAAAQEGFRASLPEGHFVFSFVDEQAALLALARGETAVALVALDRAIAHREAALPVCFLPALLARRAEAHRRLDRFADARTDAERALAIDRESIPHGEVSSHLGRDWLALAHVLRAQGDHAGAIAAFTSAREHLEATLGPDHPATQEATLGTAAP